MHTASMNTYVAEIPAAKMKACVSQDLVLKYAVCR